MTIVLSGATGTLGGLIARALTERGAKVRALARADSPKARLAALHHLGATVARVDYRDPKSLRDACAGASCVVSALSGVRDVIVEAQTALLDAAVAAGCPRFIPSDFAIDFEDVPEGANRNFDLRRQFRRRLDVAPISATSILCGAFMELLTGEAPFLLPQLRRVLAWGGAHPPMEFTTQADTAAFTAEVALDASTPRTLRIVGSRVTAEQLAWLATQVSGRRFRVLDAGSLARLERIIRVTRRVARAFDLRERTVFPAWQGMQYMRDMYAGRGRLAPLDNDRYPNLRWTSVAERLAEDPRLIAMRPRRQRFAPRSPSIAAR